MPVTCWRSCRKPIIPNYSEFYEQRHFVSADTLSGGYGERGCQECGRRDHLCTAGDGHASSSATSSRCSRLAWRSARTCGCRIRRPPRWRRWARTSSSTCPLRMRSSARQATAATLFVSSPADCCARTCMQMPVSVSPRRTSFLRATTSSPRTAHCWPRARCSRRASFTPISTSSALHTSVSA